MGGKRIVLVAAALALLAWSCAASANLEESRRGMVNLLRRYGIADEDVLGAMAEVPRHLYIPEEYRWLRDPYGDHACPIGHGQTISQPYIVAYMTEQIDPAPGKKVLEIGTGSGYQAAILAELGAEVYTIEIIPELAEHADSVLESQGYENVHVLTGDGYLGWPEHSPFDAVIVTCAPEEIPRALVEQLADGGRMILPLGDRLQRLVILEKEADSVRVTEDMPVRFVPMVHGEEE
ncbi:protein-L-isoaspartate(D-aspartate) O-methyltransferase [Candidatus Fermentibacteria bacterium]|nr:protein-L-isoaspartate(D-aspartate) O-methyltransferase [Candidatus Fermentibacteria bacterium]